MTIRQVRVLEDVCLAHGVCEYVLPEVFNLSGSVATLTPLARDFYVSHAGAIREVADDMCPVQAIIIESDGADEPSPDFLTFDEAMRQFASFLAEQGCTGPLAWIYREDVLLRTNTPVLRWPVRESNEAMARLHFTRGRNRGLGVELLAHFTIHGSIAASVRYPEDVTDAEYSLISGVKFAMVNPLREAHASRLPWTLQTRRPVYRRTQALLESIPSVRNAG